MFSPSLEKPDSAEIVGLRLKERDAVADCVNHNLAAVVLQPHCGEEPQKTEAVVAMEVADKDMREARPLQAHFHEHSLRSLAAINHEKFVVDIQNLARGVVDKRRLRRAAPQDVKFHTSHGVLFYSIDILFDVGKDIVDRA